MKRKIHRIDLNVTNKKIDGEFTFNENSKLRLYCLDNNLTPNLNPIQYSFINIEDIKPSIIINSPNTEFEIDESYYNIAQRRLKEHVPVKEVSHKKPTTLENLLY